MKKGRWNVPFHYELRFTDSGEVKEAIREVMDLKFKILPALEDVDDLVKAPDGKLVAVVGDVGGEVGVEAVGPAEQMLGNGMVLRETIGSSTLAYLQMAVYTLDEGAEDEVIGLKLLQVLDNIMAFRGCYDDFIAEDAVRNTIKCGASVERLSYTLRTGLREEFFR